MIRTENRATRLQVQGRAAPTLRFNIRHRLCEIPCVSMEVLRVVLALAIIVVRRAHLFQSDRMPLTFLLHDSRIKREVVEKMSQPKLTKLELQILEALWAHSKASIREIQEAFPVPRPAYTTIQTTVYRLEQKKAVRRIRKISNAHIFEPIVARDVTRHRLLDEILSFFGGRAQPMMAQLAEAGKLTLDDIRELEKTIKKLDEARKQEGTAKSK